MYDGPEVTEENLRALEKVRLLYNAERLTDGRFQKKVTGSMKLFRHNCRQQLIERLHKNKRLLCTALIVPLNQPISILL